MKYLINKIIVVEGKEDVSYLSSFIDAEFVITNGYDIPKEEIEYLNEASKYKEVLVLTDPDEAGRKIENKLKEKLQKATYILIDISKCNKGKKLGVAECDKQEILKVLEPYFGKEINENKSNLNGKLSKIDLSDKELRKYLSNRFKLGICNSKKIINRLETLNIKYEEIDKAIKEYRSGN